MRRITYIFLLLKKCSYEIKCICMFACTCIVTCRAHTYSCKFRVTILNDDYFVLYLHLMSWFWYLALIQFDFFHAKIYRNGSFRSREKNHTADPNTIPKFVEPIPILFRFQLAKNVESKTCQLKTIWFSSFLSTNSEMGHSEIYMNHGAINNNRRLTSARKH